jgi:putative tryptophan/tyrosine transport system substrate-binding protein
MHLLPQVGMTFVVVYAREHKRSHPRGMPKRISHMSTIGYLHSGTSERFGPKTAPWIALESALPKGTVIKDMYGLNDPGLLDNAASELVNDKSVEVIVAAGGPAPALVLQAKTKTKPIVFTTVADPVLSKLVDDYETPGHNLTGMWGMTSELDGDRLGLLFTLAKASLKKNDKVGVLLKSNRDHAKDHYKNIEKKAAEPMLSLKLEPVEVGTVAGIKAAFDILEKKKVKGLVVTADSFFNDNRKEVVAEANARGIPAIYQWKEFVEEHQGLISYGPDISEAYRMAGEYVTAILEKRSEPSTMPCSKPSQFLIHFSSATARKLGIEVPEMILGIRVQAI